MTEDLRLALETLKGGGVIAYPTDTIWGIGCDATNPAAVRRVYDIKHRADSKALITLVGSLAQLERTASGIAEVAYQLIEYSDRPVTIIYDGALPSARLAPELMSSDGTIAIRVTTEPFSRMLCERLRRPIVSTSANISGQPAPASFADIAPELLEAVDYVCLTGRDYQPGKPSSIIRLSEDGLFKIIR